MSEIKIELEPFSRELFSQLVPFGQKCWDESSIAKGGKCAYYGERNFICEPDVDQYERIANMGNMAIFTVRNAGALVGFVIGFTYQCLHHRPIIGAIGDIIYIEPEFRSYTPILVEKFAKRMKEMGAQTIGWPATEGGPVYQVLKALGFVGDDVVMEKRL